MTCHFCNIECKKFGKYGLKKIQRYRCKVCGRTFSDPQDKPLEDMRVSLDKAMLAINLLAEGAGIRAISRVVGLHQETVLGLLEFVGEKCSRLLDSKIRNIRVKQLQIDEVWSFVHCKQKNIEAGQSDAEIGDQYTFVSLDRHTKLVVNFVVGKRDATNAYSLLRDLSTRISGRFQLTTDGFAPYVECTEIVFGSEIDYAQLIKIYAGGEANREGYSPSECIGALPKIISGDPNPIMISTSHVERSNLSMRTFIRRFTRLCLGFSKKLANLKSALALYFAYYNFCRIHKSLRVTPAMEAGITDHIWSVQDLISPSHV